LDAVDDVEEAVWLATSLSLELAAAQEETDLSEASLGSLLLVGLVAVPLVVLLVIELQTTRVVFGNLGVG